MIDFDADGKVALITMNRPEARNAVNGAISRGLEEAIDRLEDDNSLWLGILTHTGPVFSAGADLKAISGGALPGVVHHPRRLRRHRPPLQDEAADRGHRRPRPWLAGPR